MVGIAIPPVHPHVSTGAGTGDWVLVTVFAVLAALAMAWTLFAWWRGRRLPETFGGAVTPESREVRRAA